MVKFFSQSYKYDDAWQTVTLAFFLRYPNPYAAHVLSCDVISRVVTENGTLRTTRLISKTGPVPAWFPKSFLNRAETWVIEESEVDPEGRIVNCRTSNLDHVKVMQVQEDVVLKASDDGSTVQKTTASIVSNFGWGLTKKIEKYGISKFKANLERSRAGISVVLSALRESRQRFEYHTAPLGVALTHPSILEAQQRYEQHSASNHLLDADSFDRESDSNGEPVHTSKTEKPSLPTGNDSRYYSFWSRWLRGLPPRSGF
ncbi:hypothetical protein FRC03_010092 [Tulasnella sp. 419]|nr:hypothetical protein FRC02_000007 [Tulasnella sp. 418]KAG8967347.1 hypothetical protein FRC03_010092 [Tulasnella sp. 419]